MVRKLAIAAAVIGACALITPSFGKSGGGGGGFHAPLYTGMAPNVPHAPYSMRPRAPLYTGLAPAFRSRHRGAAGYIEARRLHRPIGYGFYGYGYVMPVAPPAIYDVPEDPAPAPGAVAVWRGPGTGGCSAEVVQVRGDKGMDELTITRC